MRPDDLRRVLRRQPFLPFRLCLVDGTDYEFRHPENVLVEWSTLTIPGRVANFPGALADQEVIVALLHVSRMEPIEQRPPQALTSPPI